MRELLVDTLSSEEASCTFHYYILIDQMDVYGGFACESYGVKIAQAHSQDDSVSIPNITTSVSRIDELMELLTRNFVTPTTLKDVVDDWL